MKKIGLIFLSILLTITSSDLFAKIYKGAEYRTKETFLYGRFESSFKAAGKEGTLSTMFTYFDGTETDPWASNKWNEIDIEILGRYKNDVQFNTITSGSTNHVRHNLVNFDPAVDYHTYAFEWTPDYIAWFIDGVEVYRQTDNFVKTVTRAQKLMFNMWIPSYANWMGVFTDKILPAFTSYDWASYYAYTPGKGNYGTGNNFTLSWRDEFDSFDSNRWEKATHTWDGNLSDMLPGNINFADGKMILSLTTSTATGLADKKLPEMLSARAINENLVQVFFSEQVEKVSAETASQYVIPGMPDTKKATLLNDKRTVELSVEKLNMASLPNLILMAGVKDLANPANTSITHLKTIISTPQFKFPIKINIGGNAYNDFLADREFNTDTASYGYMEGSKISTTSDITNTTDDPVFQVGINNLAKYVVRVPNGKYRVKLLFSENWLSSENVRVFDVYIQGKQAIKAFDIYKEVGTKISVEKVFEDVIVNDYMLDVHFAALKNSGFINGIIIEQTGTDIEEHSSIPNSYQLDQNFPNPFNPETTISYKLQAASNVSLKIYDALGREVSTLVNELKQPGVHNSQFSTLNSKLSSGVYFYTLRAGDFVQTKKMMLIK
ncbi:MAG: family 16 glycosylhydrolase [Melioribacteraceae bacterium]